MSCVCANGVGSMNIPGYSEEVGALDYELVMYSLIYIYF